KKGGRGGRGDLAAGGTAAAVTGGVGRSGADRDHRQGRRRRQAASLLACGGRRALLGRLLSRGLAALLQPGSQQGRLGSGPFQGEVEIPAELLGLGEIKGIVPYPGVDEEAAL